MPSPAAAPAAPVTACPYLGRCLKGNFDDCANRERCVHWSEEWANDHSFAPHYGRAFDLPDDPARDARFGFALLCVSACAVLLVAWLIGRHLLGPRLSARAEPAPAAPAVAYSCPAPARDGDRLVVVIKHDGGRLTFDCRSIGDWRNP